MPGPGAYDSGYKNKKSSEIKFTSSRRGLNNRPQTPGPGSYEHADLYQKKGISISGVRGKKNIELTPGPGAYESEGLKKRPVSAK